MSRSESPVSKEAVTSTEEENDMARARTCIEQNRIKDLSKLLSSTRTEKCNKLVVPEHTEQVPDMTGTFTKIIVREHEELEDRTVDCFTVRQKKSLLQLCTEQKATDAFDCVFLSLIHRAFSSRRPGDEDRIFICDIYKKHEQSVPNDDFFTLYHGLQRLQTELCHLIPYHYDSGDQASTDKKAKSAVYGCGRTVLGALREKIDALLLAPNTVEQVRAAVIALVTQAKRDNQTVKIPWYSLSFFSKNAAAIKKDLDRILDDAIRVSATKTRNSCYH